MNVLPMAQKIKIIKKAGLKIPVYRAPTEDYDHIKPTKFDRHIMQENVDVTQVISFLLSTVTYLSKELMLCGKPIPSDVWKNLVQIRDLVRDQRNSQGR